MSVIVGCEFSGIVRQAFRNKGFDAYSCDLLESEDGSKYHIQGDIITTINNLERKPKLAILHPPCTNLAVSGARWFKDKKAEQERDLDFVKQLMALDIEKICIENPISIISSRIRKPDQIIQPWQFGHGETKATCLWLKNLPKLKPSNVVLGREQRVFKEPPSQDRWKNRSRTYTGIAEAMANQWGDLIK